MNKGFAISVKRKEKAMKIEAVLQDFLHMPIKDKKILDIGAGSGEIGEYFSKDNKVYSVDVTDQRKIKKGNVKFKLVKSERLPFKDNSFDIVISNHVIEHLKNQNLHLSEIKRVLKKRAVCYLATPNKNFPIEPHYNFPVIHYFPDYIFFRILKMIKKYKEDVKLLPYNKLILLCKKYFQIFDYTKKIIQKPKNFFYKNKLIKIIPNFLLNLLIPISPTVILILKKK